MLRSMKDLRGYTLNARDGNVGLSDDFYFDDVVWKVRYLVADTGTWLPGKKVVISPVAVGSPDWEQKEIPVELTQKQIEESPSIDEKKPIERHYEESLADYYRWPLYWDQWKDEILTPGEATETAAKGDVDPTLRGASETLSYDVESADGEDVGHIHDYIVEDDTWRIRYLVLDTRDWLPGGKKTLIPVNWVSAIGVADKKAHIDVKKDQIEQSPDYDPSQPVNRQTEEVLYDYYGRPKYWT